MSKELAVVLINPYTTAKSRTGGVIGRFLSRTGLELAAARMFAPGKELVEEYAELVESNPGEEPEDRRLVSDYIRKSYSPDPVNGLPLRVFMLLLEGEDAVLKVRRTAGSVKMSGGESVRDTFGDCVLDANGRVVYFEPAVLVGSDVENTRSILRLWAKHSESESGIVSHAADVDQSDNRQMTLVLIKPDNFLFPTARPGNIIDVLSRSGLRIVAAKVLRMSPAQAEELYGPIRRNLRDKMRRQVAERAARALESEFKMPPPPEILKLMEEKLGPALGDEQFNQLVKFMTGKDPLTCADKERHAEGLQRSLALIYAGPNAVAIIRNLLGTTDPTKADFGSVRREFGLNIMLNAAHASDSVRNAEREIGVIGFEDDAISPWVEKYYGR